MDGKLKKMLFDECGCKMSDELFARFVDSMTEYRLQNKEVLIPYGKLDTNVYVQKSGILRACYFDGENERTYGFSNPGTVVMSYHGHFMRQPSSFQIESCGESVVLKMSKKELDELIDSSHEFAKWMLAIQSAQLYINEFKHTVVSGTASERYLSLLEKRPEIIANVPSKIVASYLGVTHNHLSYLKKALREERQPAS